MSCVRLEEGGARLDPLSCSATSHRCHHAAQAYTGPPPATYGGSPATSTSSWPHNPNLALSMGASNEPSRKFDNHGEGPRGRSNRGLLRDCEISANTRSSTGNLYPSEAELRGASVRAPGGGAARAVGRGEDQAAPQPQPLPAHGHHHRRHPQQTAPAQTQEGGDF